MTSPYLAPWRLATLGGGIALLAVGSRLQPAPDWDVGISVVMAVATYLAAPFTVDVIWRRKWKWLPLALLGTYASIDGVYFLYWHLVDQTALLMRDVQWECSLCLYLICGVIWKPYR